MFRGIYTSASGMFAAERKQQILTNNLSNAQTPGFKEDQTTLRAFPEMLMLRLNDQTTQAGKPQGMGPAQIGTLHTGVYAQESIPLFTQGAVTETGKQTDVAMIDQSLPVNPNSDQKGQLFFTVQANGENRYTRNGQFTVSPEGYLTTSEGYYVLNDLQQPIEVSPEGFQIRDNGSIYQRRNGEYVQEGRLWLGYTEQPQQMVKEGNGLYRFEGQAEILQDITQVEFLNNEENELNHFR